MRGELAHDAAVLGIDRRVQQEVAGLAGTAEQEQRRGRSQDRVDRPGPEAKRLAEDGEGPFATVVPQEQIRPCGRDRGQSWDQPLGSLQVRLGPTEVPKRSGDARPQREPPCLHVPGRGRTHLSAPLLHLEPRNKRSLAGKQDARGVVAGQRRAGVEPRRSKNERVAQPRPPERRRQATGEEHRARQAQVPQGNEPGHA